MSGSFRSYLESSKMNQKEMLEKYLPVIKSEGKDYSKKVVVLARPAVVGEKIDTNTSDGKETTNTAKEGNFIVRNPTGEEYILKSDSFEKRYTHLPDGPKEGKWESYKAKGKCRAIVWNEEQITFIASWSEEMVLKKGDMLATPLPEMGEVYRIAAKEFKETYE